MSVVVQPRRRARKRPDAPGTGALCLPCFLTGLCACLPLLGLCGWIRQRREEKQARRRGAKARLLSRLEVRGRHPERALRNPRVEEAPRRAQGRAVHQRHALCCSATAAIVIDKQPDMRSGRIEWREALLGKQSPLSRLKVLSSSLHTRIGSGSAMLPS